MGKIEDNTVADPNRKGLKQAGVLKKHALLVVLSKNFFGRSHVIEKPVTIIGRQDDCDLTLADPLLSRKHCRVLADENGDYNLEDLSSTNSTYLNSKEIRKREKLHYGDRIVVGDTILRFYLEEEARKK